MICSDCQVEQQESIVIDYAAMIKFRGRCYICHNRWLDHLQGTICVVYHANCDDGFGAAWVAYKRLNNRATYLPMNYGDVRKDFNYYKDRFDHIFIVDFSFPREIMLTLIEKCKTVRVLDHHKTAFEEIGDMKETHFNMKKSGAMLAWDYFFGPEPAPQLIRYIQDRDLFTKLLPDIDEFTAGLRSYPHQFSTWDGLVGMMVAYLKNEGRSILRAQSVQIDRITKHPLFYEWDNKAKIPVINSGLYISEVCEKLLFDHPYAPFSFVFWYQDDKQIVASLRSRQKENIDVAAIAKKFGGGGHTHAAGFVVNIKDGMTLDSLFEPDFKRIK